MIKAPTRNKPISREFAKAFVFEWIKEIEFLLGVEFEPHVSESLSATSYSWRYDNKCIFDLWITKDSTWNNQPPPMRPLVEVMDGRPDWKEVFPAKPKTRREFLAAMEKSTDKMIERFGNE